MIRIRPLLASPTIRSFGSPALVAFAILLVLAPAAGATAVASGADSTIGTSTPGVGLASPQGVSVAGHQGVSVAGHQGAGLASTLGANLAGPRGASATSLQDAGAATTQPNPCVGTVTDRPDNSTLISIQGARGSDKTEALLLGVRPDGSVVGVHDETAHGRWWAYDVDPMPNGNLLMATTEPGIAVVEEVDPATGEHVSVRRFEELHDTHDVDLVGEDELVMNDMSKEGEDRVVVYNLTREEVVWEYRFAEHTDEFPASGGGDYEDDWTHNNDVEVIDDGVFMVSVRNFDQVVAIDRETKEIAWRFGEDENHDVLFEQHNPDYLEGENGTPTLVVADSRNDRVVEYAHAGTDDQGNDQWEQTWAVGGLDEPRDADRLPNGNTLVTDRRGHRVVEVTPEGEVVWEFYTPWQPYDAERVGTGDESSGPTMREAGATGTHEVTGSTSFETDRIEQCHDFLASWDGGSQLVPDDELGLLRDGPATDTGTDDGETETTDRPVSTDDPILGTSTDTPPAWLWLAAGALAVLGLAGVGVWLTRR